MYTRIFIVLALLACLAVIPGCLDDTDRGDIGKVQTWMQSCLTNSDGTVIPIPRSDLDSNAAVLGGVLHRSDSRWSGMESLLALCGVGSVGGVGVTVWLRRLMGWRNTALEIIEGFERAKSANSSGAYVIDKSKIKSAMSEATISKIEAVRAQLADATKPVGG